MSYSVCAKIDGADRTCIQLSDLHRRWPQSPRHVYLCIIQVVQIDRSTQMPIVHCPLSITSSYRSSNYNKTDQTHTHTHTQKQSTYSASPAGRSIAADVPSSMAAHPLLSADATDSTDALYHVSVHPLLPYHPSSIHFAHTISPASIAIVENIPCLTLICAVVFCGHIPGFPTGSI